MSKHLDYVQQPDGSFKWELAEIPAVNPLYACRNYQSQKKKLKESFKEKNNKSTI